MHARLTLCGCVHLHTVFTNPGLFSYLCVAVFNHVLAESYTKNFNNMDPIGTVDDCLFLNYLAVPIWCALIIMHTKHLHDPQAHVHIDYFLVLREDKHAVLAIFDGKGVTTRKS